MAQSIDCVGFIRKILREKEIGHIAPELRQCLLGHPGGVGYRFPVCFWEGWRLEWCGGGGVEPTFLKMTWKVGRVVWQLVPEGR